MRPPGARIRRTTTAPHANSSVLAAARAPGCQVTIRIAVVTDIHHMHPDADGAALGAASHTDFRLPAGVARVCPHRASRDHAAPYRVGCHRGALTVAKGNTGPTVRVCQACEPDYPPQSL
jgi:hypothetical protein